MNSAHSMQHHYPASTRNPGFTLVEVLVTLLILSVGLLGLAGMIGQSLRFNQGGYTRSQSTFLAYDIIDAMRADPSNADDYAVGFDDDVHVCVVNPDATDNLVNATLGCWYGRVGAELPGGTATIVNDPDNDNVLEYEITMRWVDRTNSNRPVFQTWTVEIS